MYIVVLYTNRDLNTAENVPALLSSLFLVSPSHFVSLSPFARDAAGRRAPASNDGKCEQGTRFLARESGRCRRRYYDIYIRNHS